MSRRTRLFRRFLRATAEATQAAIVSANPRMRQEKVERLARALFRWKGRTR